MNVFTKMLKLLSKTIICTFFYAVFLIVLFALTALFTLNELYVNAFHCTGILMLSKSAFFKTFFILSFSTFSFSIFLFPLLLMVFACLEYSISYFKKEIKYSHRHCQGLCLPEENQRGESVLTDFY